jgi:hypothetical protein
MRINLMARYAERLASATDAIAADDTRRG